MEIGTPPYTNYHRCAKHCRKPTVANVLNRRNYINSAQTHPHHKSQIQNSYYIVQMKGSANMVFDVCHHELVGALYYSRPYFRMGTVGSGRHIHPFMQLPCMFAHV
jgi:hypothetical protein